jgi:hypothetical protein
MTQLAKKFSMNLNHARYCLKVKILKISSILICGTIYGKKDFLGDLAVVLVLLVWNWQLVAYGCVKAMGRCVLFGTQRPISRVNGRNPDFPDSLKRQS